MGITTVTGQEHNFAVQVLHLGKVGPFAHVNNSHLHPAIQRSQQGQALTSGKDQLPINHNKIKCNTTAACGGPSDAESTPK